jgi:predicted RNA binding protein YcfA (HicA-like mRNA interferase family)
MSSISKAIERLRAGPADFTWDELVRVLTHFGYEDITTGGGSHRKFRNPATGRRLMLPKPHNPAIVRAYVLRDVVQQLEEMGHIK